MVQPERAQTISLGITDYRDPAFCFCCGTFKGEGRRNQSNATYCVPCWESRENGALCQHKPLPEVLPPQTQRSSVISATQ